MLIVLVLILRCSSLGTHKFRERGNRTDTKGSSLDNTMCSAGYGHILTGSSVSECEEILRNLDPLTFRAWGAQTLAWSLVGKGWQ